MLRYKLRTLLIVLALGPPAMAFVWGRYVSWKARQERHPAYSPYIDPAWFREDYQFWAPVEPDPDAPPE